MGLNQQNTKQSKSINGCFTHTSITTTKKLICRYGTNKRNELNIYIHTRREREREIIFKFSSFELLKKNKLKKNDDKIEKKREKSKKENERKNHLQQQQQNIHNTNGHTRPFYYYT